MLKLYTDKSFLTETYRRQVFPLLFDLVYKPHERLLKLYHIVEVVEEADIVVLPIDYSSFLKQQDACMTLVSAAKKYGKPLWIYTAGDYGFTNYIKNSYTFRLGGFSSRLSVNTLVMPSFINDPYQVYLEGGFSTLAKKSKPTIGFVGHAQSGVIKYFKEVFNHFKYQIKRRTKRIMADKHGFYPSGIIRAKYLKQLKSNKAVETQFILRAKYRAGLHSKLTQEESTLQFYKNIYSNAYTFCSRGVGNFSVRFYETLAVGRIPILLNTDCRLPFENVIDWEKHCVIINEKSAKTMVEQVVDFHERLSDLEFENLQEENRNLWLYTLRRDAYFTHVYSLFSSY